MITSGQFNKTIGKSTHDKTPGYRERLLESKGKRPPVSKKKPVTQEKAKEIMRDGTVHGHPLSPKQKGLFGLIAGGGTPTKSRMIKHNPSPPYPSAEGCYEAAGKHGVGLAKHEK